MKKVVCLGGGTGLSTLLIGLRKYAILRQILLTVGVAMTDNGGNTRYWRKLGHPAVGDIRRALKELARNSFAQSFNDPVTADGLEHKFGNWWICRLLDRNQGDVLAAFSEANRILQTVGRVLPVTPGNTQLLALLRSGERVLGESAIPERTVDDPIARLYLEHDDVQATPELLDAIREADMVILGPGSFFTSTVAAILPIGILSAIREMVDRGGRLAYVANVSTERGETQGWSVERHLEELAAYTSGMVRICVVNDRVIMQSADQSRLNNIHHITTSRSVVGGVQIVAQNLVNDKEPLRHNPEALAETLIGILYPTAPTLEVESVLAACTT